jgi:hypothetical protein
MRKIEYPHDLADREALRGCFGCEHALALKPKNTDRLGNTIKKVDIHQVICEIMRKRLGVEAALVDTYKGNVGDGSPQTCPRYNNAIQWRPDCPPGVKKREKKRKSA